MTTRTYARKNTRKSMTTRSKPAARRTWRGKKATVRTAAAWSNFYKTGSWTTPKAGTKTGSKRKIAKNTIRSKKAKTTGSRKSVKRTATKRTTAKRTMTKRTGTTRTMTKSRRTSAKSRRPMNGSFMFNFANYRASRSVRRTGSRRKAA